MYKDAGHGNDKRKTIVPGTLLCMGFGETERR